MTAREVRSSAEASRSIGRMGTRAERGKRGWASRPWVPIVLMACVTSACGKKGAPLAPLYLVPAAVTDVSARRADDAVRLRFVLPATNVNGPGIDLDRVRIYAIT